MSSKTFVFFGGFVPLGWGSQHSHMSSYMLGGFFFALRPRPMGPQGGHPLRRRIEGHKGPLKPGVFHPGALTAGRCRPGPRGPTDGVPSAARAHRAPAGDCVVPGPLRGPGSTGQPPCSGSPPGPLQGTRPGCTAPDWPPAQPPCGVWVFSSLRHVLNTRAAGTCLHMCPRSLTMASQGGIPLLSNPEGLAEVCTGASTHGPWLGNHAGRV